MSINKYEKFGSRGFAPGNTEGDIVFFGGGQEEYSVVQGKLYYLNSLMLWSLADADEVSTSTNLLAIALDTGDPGEVGMLLRGMVSIAESAGTGAGIPLFISTTAGNISRSAPTGAGDVVRVVGYNVGAGNSTRIWFNPDNTWIEIAE